MKKELPHYRIGSSYGGNQEWFRGFMMKIGGCAAETAIECCIYFDRSFSTKLCPFDVNKITKEDFISFGEIMKPYLTPRMSGINRLSLFTDGFSDYLKSKNSSVSFENFEGDRPYEAAERALVNQLDNNIPVPYLCLYHSDRRFKDYEWHWFLINGYEIKDGRLLVKAVTYSAWEWLDFYNLWHTGRENKGGMVLLSLDENNE